MTRLRSFGVFWLDFVVGDDWRLAGGAAVALVCTGALARERVDAWWLLPAAVAVLLAGSLRRAVRGGS